jgi:crotonobetainyl-CoA:carnitine CoA-transferase CaiB-like acyl-CoA transferase
MISDKRILRGLRVLDCGRYIAVPYCAMILADMGAEVIRIERPSGEEDRYYGLKASNGENFTFPGLARNKKGITLDIAAEEGREVMSDLVAISDVFLHNFSLGAVKAMRLGYEDVRIRKPNIIYAAVSCYGEGGPYAKRTGFDPIAQVSSGAAAVSGFEDDPLRSGVPWVDYSTGLCAAIGVLLALRHRDATGDGQAVDCALLQTAISFTTPMIAEAIVAGKERPRLGNRGPYLGASDLHKCSDGYVFISTVTETMWQSLMNVIGRPDLIGLPELGTDEQRFENRALVDPLIKKWVGCHTVEEVVTKLEKARIPCGVYRTTAQVSQDPQVQAQKMIEYMDLELVGLEQMPVTGLPVRLSKCPGVLVSRAPRVGEHNDEIYRCLLGFDDRRIADLRSKRVI